MNWPLRRLGRIDLSAAAKLPVASGRNGSTPQVGVEGGHLRLTAQRLEAQLEKLIPGPMIPMKSPQIKILTTNHKALNGIRPSPTPW
jgi:hypothetical protein